MTWLLSSWVWGSVLGLIVVAVVALAALGLLRPVMDWVTPLAKALAEVIGDGLKWFWNTIAKPGLGDIADNGATIIVVALLVLGGVLWGKADTERRLTALGRELGTCTAQLKAAKGKVVTKRVYVPAPAGKVAAPPPPAPWSPFEVR